MGECSSGVVSVRSSCRSTDAAQSTDGSWPCPMSWTRLRSRSRSGTRTRQPNCPSGAPCAFRNCGIYAPLTLTERQDRGSTRGRNRGAGNNELPDELSARAAKTWNTSLPPGDRWQRIGRPRREPVNFTPRRWPPDQLQRITENTLIGLAIGLAIGLLIAKRRPGCTAARRASSGGHSAWGTKARAAVSRARSISRARAAWAG